MGANMATCLLRGGHQVVAFDLNEAAIQAAEAAGAVGARTLDEVAAKLTAPRVAWVMVPSGDPTGATINALADRFAPGDIIIDGGNSNYKDSMRRAADLQARGQHFVDVGTSGGVWGLAEGYSMMVGGEVQAVEQIRPILETLAPAVDQGWGRVGPAGAGHFVKMIHNGIEYGLMQAYAEGFEIMKAKKEFDLSLSQDRRDLAYRQRGALLAARPDRQRPGRRREPDRHQGLGARFGEGRWTVFEAIDLDVAAPVITMALQRRLRSRDEAPFSDKLLAAIRNQFGGHAVKQAE